MGNARIVSFDAALILVAGKFDRTSTERCFSLQSLSAGRFTVVIMVIAGEIKTSQCVYISAHRQVEIANIYSNANHYRAENERTGKDGRNSTTAGGEKRRTRTKCKANRLCIQPVPVRCGKRNKEKRKHLGCICTSVNRHVGEPLFSTAASRSLLVFAFSRRHPAVC